MASKPVPSARKEDPVAKSEGVERSGITNNKKKSTTQGVSIRIPKSETKVGQRTIPEKG